METSTQQREEREKGKLVKRDSVPQSPRCKPCSRPASSADERGQQEESAGLRAGTGLWVHQFGNWVVGQGKILRKEEEEDDG